MSRKWNIAISNDESDLLVGGSAPGDEHDVEAGETADGNDEKADDDHDDDRNDRLRSLQVIFAWKRILCFSKTNDDDDDDVLRSLLYRDCLV